MAVTFGTRSAMRDLAEELGPGEQVVELAACSYAGAAGLVALTTDRVIAVRDDYSKHQVQFVVVAEVVTIDYDPTVHDGFALFTATGRLVVRKMRREDGDRLVDALLTRAPHILVQVTRRGAPLLGKPNPQASAGSPALGRHRRPMPASAPASTLPPIPAPAAPRPGEAAVAQAGAAAQVAAAAQPAAATPPVAPLPPLEPLPPVEPLPPIPPVSPPVTPAGGDLAGAPASAVGVAVEAGTPAAPGAPAASAPAYQSTAAQSGAVPSAAQGGPRPATDKEILLGVLADLHAQGVLTAEEFAAKVRHIVAQP